MDRYEFGNMMKKARKDSGMKTTDIIGSSGMMYNEIMKFEVGKSNFVLKRVVKYIDTIGYCISFIKREDLIIDSEESIYKFIHTIVPDKECTSIKLYYIFGVTQPSSWQILNKQINLTIDPFLRFYDHFHLTPVIVKKKI